MGQLFYKAENESDIWTISELNAYLRELFEIDYRLQDIRVTGEISNFTRARSGHLYFTLKDEQAQLRCVMWRSSASNIGVVPEEGDEVIAHGRISVYEEGGVYQLYADSLTTAGRGSLAVAFEELRTRLATEGLFDVVHKKKIKEFPAKIGVVTSADAAALRDILNVLRRRWPATAVLVVPTLVQGKEAPAQIVSALNWVDGRNDIDTVILARGGGTIEDLAAFNDETVARTIFLLEHPVIVGVGHETDFTIADFVADLRAPTPSAAAELAVSDQAEVNKRLTLYETSLITSIQKYIHDRRTSLQALRRTLKQLSPVQRIQNGVQTVDWLTIRLDAAMISLLESFQSRLSLASKALDSVGPMNTLARGYAIVQRKDSQIVRTVDQVNTGDALDIRVLDGTFGATVNQEDRDDRELGAD